MARSLAVAVAVAVAPLGGVRGASVTTGRRAASWSSVAAPLGWAGLARALQSRGRGVLGTLHAFRSAWRPRGRWLTSSPPLSLSSVRPLSKTVRFNVLKIDRVLSGGGKQFSG